MSRKLRKAINKLNLSPRRAILGDSAGVVHEPGRKGYVRVRYIASPENADSRTWPTSLLLDPQHGSVPTNPGQPVLVGYNKFGRLCVIGIDSDGMLASGTNPIIANPGTQEAHGFQDQRNITTLRCQAVGTGAPMSISVLGWLYVDSNGTLHGFIGEQINLTAYIPDNAGEHCIALVLLKTDDTLEVAVSTPKDSVDPITIADVQEAYDSAGEGSYPIWTWRLENGMTALFTERQQFNDEDWRQIVNSGLGGSGGAGVNSDELNEQIWIGVV
jgi:hypothetical protein